MRVPEGAGEFAMRTDLAGRTRAPGGAEGFSLIEMMVVITIMLILVGLLTAVIFGAKERSRRLSCMSNLRSIYIATEMYAESHRGYIPRATGKGSDWFNAIQPYITGIEFGEAAMPLEEVEIFHCPSAPNLTLSYCINAFDDGASGPAPLESFRERQNTVLYTESRADPANAPMGYSDVTSADHIPGGNDPRVDGSRHMGGINVVYADGHSEMINDPAEVLTADDFVEVPP